MVIQWIKCEISIRCDFFGIGNAYPEEMPVSNETFLRIARTFFTERNQKFKRCA